VAPRAWGTVEGDCDEERDEPHRETELCGNCADWIPENSEDRQWCEGSNCHAPNADQPCRFSPSRWKPQVAREPKPTPEAEFPPVSKEEAAEIEQRVRDNFNDELAESKRIREGVQHFMDPASPAPEPETCGGCKHKPTCDAWCQLNGYPAPDDDSRCTLIPKRHRARGDNGNDGGSDGKA
jgi:hypothetical protein